RYDTNSRLEQRCIPRRDVVARGAVDEQTAPPVMALHAAQERVAGKSVATPERVEAHVHALAGQQLALRLQLKDECAPDSPRRAGDDDVHDPRRHATACACTSDCRNATTRSFTASISMRNASCPCGERSTSNRA